jgi:hypothetical protein
VVPAKALIFTTESRRVRRKNNSGGFDRDKRDTGDKTIKQAEPTGQTFSFIKPFFPSPSSLLKALEFI